jgi:hypothetical protein
LELIEARHTHHEHEKGLRRSLLSLAKYEGPIRAKKKTRYLTCRRRISKAIKAIRLKLEALPVNFDGWINFYEPKAREQTSDQREAGSAC